MLVKYFKVCFESRITQHPNGKFRLYFLIENQTKKDALRVAKIYLDRTDKQFTKFYKSPFILKMFSKLEFELEKKRVDKLTRHEKEREKYCFDNEQKKTLTINDHDLLKDGGHDNEELKRAVMIVVLYDSTDNLNDETVKECERLANNPQKFLTDVSELKAFEALFNLCAVYIIDIFKLLSRDDLMLIVSYIEKQSNKISDKKTFDTNIKNFIKCELGIEKNECDTVKNLQENEVRDTKDNEELDHLVEENKVKAIINQPIDDKKIINNEELKKEVDTMNSCLELAKFYYKSNFILKEYKNNIVDCALVIKMGIESGLSTLEALQSEKVKNMLIMVDVVDQDDKQNKNEDHKVGHAHIDNVHSNLQNVTNETNTKSAADIFFKESIYDTIIRKIKAAHDKKSYIEALELYEHEKNKFSTEEKNILCIIFQQVHSVIKNKES